MARPLRIEFPGAFYHVTSRGNERKDIFRSRKDREQFLSYLESATERYGAVIHAYCLMSNHYHLLLETPEGNLSRIMRHINGAYTTYFNVKRKRAGHLFQGRFKSIIVDADEYACELSRYIHLNPVRAGIVSRPEEYEWSSYRCYVALAEAPAWLQTNFILGYIHGKGPTRTYLQFVNDSRKQEMENPLNGVVASTILGSREFIRKITRQYLADKPADRNIPAARRLQRPTLHELMSRIENMSKTEKRLSRNVTIFFCHRYSGARLSEIGAHFNLSDAAISQASRRVRLVYENDNNVREELDCIRRELEL